MNSLDDLKIKLFMDGAEIAAMRRAVADMPLIKGFTTNPTLMRRAGISDYKAFALEAIEAIGSLPISFEVFSDEFDQMERQAQIIRSWGGHTYVKIPVTNTRGESAAPLIHKLSSQGIALNVTAIMTLDQVQVTLDALSSATPAIISVFAGRIADTGVDPVPLMTSAKRATASNSNCELLWASPRELLNVFQADAIGCDILTATPDVLAKLSLAGKDLEEYSLETVKMFFNDARSAAFALS